MGLFFKKRDLTERRIFQLQSILRASFGKVKSDTNLIFQWLNYFNQKIMQQQDTIASQKSLISSMKNDLDLIPKRQEIKRMIDESFAYEDMLEKIKNFEQKLNVLSPSITEQTPRNDIFELNKRLEKLEEKKSNLKEKLLKKITRNSKDYVKSIMTSMIKKYHKISALQLKEMIVEEQGLCSKSSFYRMLEEIEDKDDIAVVKEGKEKHYLSKIHNHVQK